MKWFPALSFWYSVGPNEWARTPIWCILNYIMELPSLIKQQRAVAIEAAVFPWVDAETREHMLSEASVEEVDLAPLPRIPEATETLGGISRVSVSWGIPLVMEED